jgi:Ran GTPase-activating protein (RanGAP) involved in mRNA processing and transport
MASEESEDVLGFLSPSERESVVSVIQVQHHDLPIFALASHLVSDKACKKKGTAEERLLVLGAHRLYIFRQASGKCTLTADAHLADFAEVISADLPTSVAITLKGEKSPSIVVESLGDDEFLSELYAGFLEVYGAGSALITEEMFPCKFMVVPEDRIDKAGLREDVSAGCAPCAGFSRAYLAWCDYLRCPPLPDFLFDVDQLYPFNGVVKFNLGEISRRKDGLTPRDQRVMMMALAHNTHFTKLSMGNQIAPKEAVTQLVSTLNVNVKLQELDLASCALDKKEIALVAGALGDNPRSQVHTLNLSDNPADDKSMAAVAAALPVMAGSHGLQVLKLANLCGKAGMQAVATAIIGHAPTLNSLRIADISGNKLDDASTKSWGAVLGRAPKLEEFSCGDCGMSMKALATGFGQSKLPSLRMINVSGNNLSKDKGFDSLVAMLLQAANLTDLDLKNTSLDVAGLKSIFGPTGLKKLLHARVADNNLGDAGLIGVLEALEANPSVSALYLDNNLAKKSKQRGAAMDKLVQFFERPENKITHLSLAASRGKGLKGDVVPFVFSLMMNKTLKSLDVSGNGAGSPLALALGKMLSTNHALQEVRFDDNGLDVDGFRMILTGVERNGGSLVLMPLPLRDAHEALKATHGFADIETLHELLGKIQVTVQTAAMRSAEQQGSLRASRHLGSQKGASASASASAAGPSSSSSSSSSTAASGAATAAALVDTRRASVLWADKDTVAEMEGLTPEEREQMKGIMRATQGKKEKS